jgi:hypothetical protein
MVFLLRITAGGHVRGRCPAGTLTRSGGQRRVPDGTRLAVAFCRGTSAVVQVITLGRPGPHLGSRGLVAPRLRGGGAWAGTGAPC